MGDKLPRCEKLDGSTLKIQAVECGYFCEIQALTITDGERTQTYIPLKS